MGPRLAPHGKMSIATKAMNKYAKTYSPPISTANALNATTSSTTTWTELGPKSNLGADGSGGIGQVHRIAFDPGYGTINQTVYAGSHYGGLFRSIDDGQSWSNYYTDQGLPITSVSGIAVTQNDVYVSTGNGDFGSGTEGLLSAYSSLGPGNINNANPIHTEGVYRFNGTNSWDPINGSVGSVLMVDGLIMDDLNEVFARGGTMRNIIVYNDNNSNNADDIIFVATSEGIFRSTNGGDNWQQEAR